MCLYSTNKVVRWTVDRRLSFYARGRGHHSHRPRRSRTSFRSYMWTEREQSARDGSPANARPPACLVTHSAVAVGHRLRAFSPVRVAERRGGLPSPPVSVERHTGCFARRRDVSISRWASPRRSLAGRSGACVGSVQSTSGRETRRMLPAVSVDGRPFASTRWSCRRPSRRKCGHGTHSAGGRYRLSSVRRRGREVIGRLFVDVRFP